jgi:hypothetical protein
MVMVYGASHRAGQQGKLVPCGQVPFLVAADSCHMTQYGMT